MTNLIPPDARKGVRREYWLRVASVWAFLGAVVCIILTAVFAPTYVLFDAQLKGLLLEEANKNNEQKAEYEAARTTILRANDIAAQLDPGTKTIDALTLLGAVEEAQGDGITLTSYRYAKENGEVRNINIQGIARDRTALADFADALRRSPYFAEANVPVSSLVRDQDLPFNLTVGVTVPKE